VLQVAYFAGYHYTRLEKGKVDSRISTITAIEKTFGKAGVEFLPSGDKGEGVRMRSPKA
jgi:hypothetical protein